MLDGTVITAQEKQHILEQRGQSTPVAHHVQRNHPVVYQKSVSAPELDASMIQKPNKNSNTVRKKKAKKRVALIESVRIQRAPVDHPAEEPEVVPSEFKSQIMNLRAEGGNSWLSILNELQGEQSPMPPRPQFEGKLRAYFRVYHFVE